MFARWWAVLLVLLFAMAQATAKKPEVDPDSPRERAKQHFAAGEQQLAAGNYEQAISEYQQAYELAPLPAFLFNMGQAYRLANQKKKSLEFFQKYLAADPKGKGAAIAKQQIAELQKAIVIDDAAEAERKQKEDAERLQREEAERLRKQREAAEAKKKRPAVTTVPETTAPADHGPPARKTGRGLRIAGMLTGGVGVVLIGGGILFGVKASGLSDELSEEFDPGKDDDARAASRNMMILVGVGSAAVVGGGVLYWLGVRARGRARTEKLGALPWLTPELAGVALTGSF